MKRNKLLSIGLLTLSLLTTSCNKFLEAEPDARVRIDSYEKVRKLLTNAYPTSYPVVLTEYSSDNVDDNGSFNPYTGFFYDQIVYWKPIKEYFYVDGVRTAWEQHYLTINYANTALEALDQLGQEDTKAKQARGEALLLRAYGHFVLVNLFCNPYNTQTSSTDLGIPYLTEPTHQLNPRNQRGTVAQVYQMIAKDLEEGIPLISDDYYDSKVKQRYHFNKQAAYALAARFYLYYEHWAKAEEYATLALGSDPEKRLRNWKAFSTIARTADNYAKQYTSETDPANFLLLQIKSYAYSMMTTGRLMSRYSHNDRVSRDETLRAKNIWGAFTSEQGSNVDPYWLRPFVSRDNFFNYLLVPKYPSYNSTYNTIAVIFTSDETLLVRAEARVMQEKYDEAVEDLNLWTTNFLNKGNSEAERKISFTKDEIVAFYKGLDYDAANKPSIKKALHPSFTIKDEVQENLLHHVLQCRRILTLHEGLRWYDIRRYGIVVNRYEGLDTSGEKSTVVDVLGENDKRRTLQLPDEVINAELTPNER